MPLEPSTVGAGQVLWVPALLISPPASPPPPVAIKSLGPPSPALLRAIFCRQVPCACAPCPNTEHVAPQPLYLLQDAGPSVVLASPGMLQPGVSRDLFERWCTDQKSGCIFAGYSVEGTLAKQVCVQRPNEIVRQDGKSVPLAMSIEEISFSAHSDFAQVVRARCRPHWALMRGKVVCCAGGRLVGRRMVLCSKGNASATAKLCTHMWVSGWVWDACVAA